MTGRKGNIVFAFLCLMPGLTQSAGIQASCLTTDAGIPRQVMVVTTPASLYADADSTNSAKSLTNLFGKAFLYEIGRKRIRVGDQPTGPACKMSGYLDISTCVACDHNLAVQYDLTNTALFLDARLTQPAGKLADTDILLLTGTGRDYFQLSRWNYPGLGLRDETLSGPPPLSKETVEALVSLDILLVRAGESNALPEILELDEPARKTAMEYYSKKSFGPSASGIPGRARFVSDLSKISSGAGQTPRGNSVPPPRSPAFALARLVNSQFAAPAAAKVVLLVGDIPMDDSVGVVFLTESCVRSAIRIYAVPERKQDETLRRLVQNSGGVVLQGRSPANAIKGLPSLIQDIMSVESRRAELLIDETCRFARSGSVSPSGAEAFRELVARRLEPVPAGGSLPAVLYASTNILQRIVFWDNSRRLFNALNDFQLELIDLKNLKDASQKIPLMLALSHIFDLTLDQKVQELVDQNKLPEARDLIQLALRGLPYLPPWAADIVKNELAADFPAIERKVITPMTRRVGHQRDAGRIVVPACLEEE